MKMEYIKVRGAIGFKKGLGVDEVEFDLKDKSGLVALAGPNGRGKTTLLELMSPYRTFASRKGSLRHHFFLRDSFIDRRFDFNGQKWHTIIKIDSGSDRSEAFITIDGNSVVNGKVTAYDEYILNAFGSQALFYNSVFCAQGSENMSDMTAGPIKDLFVEFLRIERLAAYSKQAGIGVAYFQSKIDVLTYKKESLTKSLADLDGTEGALDGTKDSIEIKNKKRSFLESAIKDISATVQALEIKKIDHKALVDKKAALEKSLEKLLADRKDIEARLQKLKSAEIQDSHRHMDKLQEIDTILSQKDEILYAAYILKTIEELGKHFSECFECAVAEQDRINKDKNELYDDHIKPLEEKIAALETDSSVSDIKARIQDIKDHININMSELTETEQKKVYLNKDHDLIILQNNVSALEKEIGLAIDPNCKSTICPALARIEEAKLKLPIAKEDLAARIKTVKAWVEECDSIIKEAYDSIDAKKILLEKAESELATKEKELSHEIEGLRDDLVRLQYGYESLKEDYSDLEELKTFYKESLTRTREKYSEVYHLANKKDQIEATQSKRDAVEAQRAESAKVFQERNAEYTETLDNLAKSVIALEDEMSGIAQQLETNIDDEISVLIEKKRLRSIELEDLNRHIETLKTNAAVLEKDLLKKADIEKDLIATNENDKALKKEMAEWEYLKTACSKTGLQALEIDGATPLITTEANKLLEQAFGLEYQIKIITVDPESGREVFWIKVIRDDGSEDEFANLSGGQRVWIASALSLGMTLVSKRKSGLDFQTLFMDEADGALDREKAVNFIKLYRSMLKTGTFDTCFFVSHNPELVSMADHEVKF